MKETHNDQDKKETAGHKVYYNRIEQREKQKLKAQQSVSLNADQPKNQYYNCPHSSQQHQGGRYRSCDCSSHHNHHKRYNNHIIRSHDLDKYGPAAKLECEHQ